MDSICGEIKSKLEQQSRCKRRWLLHDVGRKTAEEAEAGQLEGPLHPPSTVKECIARLIPPPQKKPKEKRE